MPEGYIIIKDGVYPSDWTIKTMKQWITLEERPVTLQDDEEYELVTVRRAYGGVDSRGIYKGKEVLVKTYFSVKKNDFIISKRQIAHGACGLVPDRLNGAVVSNEYNVFKAKEGTNIQFFNLMMQLPHYKRLFYLMSDGVHIEKLLFKTSDWMKRSLAIPPLAEQEKIAEILQTQDKLIELQQKKIEELKRLKKVYLSKMFPKKGCNVPEIRFPGFTDPWEQRKLGEVVSQITTGLNPRDNFKLNSGGNNYYVTIKNFEHGVLHLDDKCDFVDDEALTLIQARSDLKKDDILFTSIGRVGDCYLIENTPKNWNINESVFSLRPNKNIVEPVYLFHTIHSDIVLNQILNNITGSTFKSIKIGDLKNVIIPIPPKQEQEQIAKLITALESLITLHQRKLDEEQKKKKALMQILLTGIVRVK